MCLNQSLENKPNAGAGGMASLVETGQKCALYGMSPIMASQNEQQLCKGMKPEMLTPFKMLVVCSVKAKIRDIRYYSPFMLRMHFFSTKLCHS